jgi:hypothetical protein
LNRVQLDGPHRDDTAGIWLLVFVVLAAAFATGLLEDQDDACTPGRVVDVRGLD